MSVDAVHVRSISVPLAVATRLLGAVGAVLSPIVPLATFEAWLTESYRAVAPKRLAATLDAGPVDGR